jgi:hypothetical protein
MNFKHYFTLYHQIQTHQESDETLRAFGIKHQKLFSQPLKLLQLWGQHATPNTQLQTPPNTTLITTLITLMAAVIGVLSAQVVLYYDGSSLVNILFFLALSVALPLLGSVVFFLSVLFANISQFSLSFLAFVLLNKLLPHHKFNTQLYDTKLFDRYFLFITQLASLVFSVTFLATFLVIISTQDIAFGWSSTLAISPEELGSFLHTIALAWNWICPQDISLHELITQSRYFRLQHATNTQLNPEILGQWWHFLACSAFFYSILLRVVTLTIAYFLLQNSFKQTLLKHPQTQEVLRAMQEVLVQTQSQQQEKKHKQTNTQTNQHATRNTQPQNNYTITYGWAMEAQKIPVVVESLQIQTQNIASVGGAHTLESDEKEIQKAHGDILVVVQAWEVPTMEFIDFIEEILLHANTITLYPVGYHTRNYQPNPKDLAVWEEKLQTEGLTTIKVIV